MRVIPTPFYPSLEEVDEMIATQEQIEREASCKYVIHEYNPEYQKLQEMNEYRTKILQYLEVKEATNG